MIGCRQGQPTVFHVPHHHHTTIIAAYGIVESERVFGALLEVDRGDFVPDEVTQRAGMDASVDRVDRARPSTPANPPPSPHTPNAHQNSSGGRRTWTSPSWRAACT